MRMRTFLGGLVGLGLAAGLGACTSGDREWMKVGQSYTVQEFRRDFAACTKNGQLDEVCMRDRGWVDVSPKAEKANKKPEPDYRNVPSGRY
jgi:hypothetical protein